MEFALEAKKGTLLQALDGTWVAFSAASGETQLLNNEAAALLEALIEKPRTISEVSELLASEAGVAPSSILHLLQDAAIEFHAAGLISRMTNR
jgi:PqqD family protein of HPr-rel-A system